MPLCKVVAARQLYIRGGNYCFLYRRIMKDLARRRLSGRAFLVDLRLLGGTGARDGGIDHGLAGVVGGLEKPGAGVTAGVAAPAWGCTG